MIDESKQEILRELQEGKDDKIQMIDESKEEILRELQESKDDKIQETGQNTEAFAEIVEQKMDKMKHEFKEQLKIKGLVDNIKRQLKHECPLFILKINNKVDLPRWEDTRNALALLECSADVLIVTTAKDIKQAKEYSYPPENEPIDYSLAGLYYDTVLEITKQREKEEGYDPHIFRNILEQCKANEFCMKIFTHALYVNPKRSNEELNKLLSILQTSPKSSDVVIAKKMFKFSYAEMPKEYKSCFLYLAIFPPGYKIRQSTLIGRWVAEGLISKEDWPSSVHWANRCFDELINRCLADPADTGAAGKVKSCVVGDLVHGFITEIARKQHMVETRLSHHLARHFSISNDLQLRVSDKIDGFFQRLSKSSRVETRLLKVLDLEGCKCFGGKNQRYLEDICSKMLLLKYLSLRGTDVTQLPSNINNLRELEVLDIRQTDVPMNATANVLLLKLKRLLAGNTDRSPRPTLRGEELVSPVLIPHKIEKMVNMEVLSNVKAKSSRDLKDIGKLWQLRKLGVVVDDDSSYLKNLLRGISDLHECLCSLAITLPTATSGATPSSQELPKVSLKLKHQPKLLESLSISGTTQKGYLLPLFVKDANNNLVKLTLSSTSLYQVNLKVLAKLPKLQFIRLRHIEFTDIESLIFEEDEFKHLKYLLVEGSSFTKISFQDKSACMLEKMALSLTNIESVSGVDSLEKLEEVELSMSSSNKKKNDTLLSSFNNGKQTMAKLTIVSTSLEQGDQETQNMITFNEGEFRKLKLLTVDCAATTKVVFTSGSAPKLEKIVCSSCTFATTEVVFTSGSTPKLEKIVWSSSTSLSGIDNLPKLMELEFNGDLVPEVVKEASKKHKNKPNLKHIKPEIQDQAKGDVEKPLL
jgi:hypothetical protein